MNTYGTNELCTVSGNSMQICDYILERTSSNMKCEFTNNSFYTVGYIIMFTCSIDTHQTYHICDNKDRI